MNKHITIEWPYDQITLDFTRAKRVVARPMTEPEWEALQKAEQRIYPSGCGVYSYTDVNVREESELPAKMWDHAWSNAEAIEDNWDSWTGHARRTVVATRVARALALLVFPPDILIK
jgi:hypothetical protein